ncbi:DUF3267 domain-containing protein [Cloacibacterium caeni]|uniref:DUF3267 domain-containing protein n=1 Tax=Cloacibacterium caeni TaxID=2004710 RepID=UPI001BCF77D8|nr:DUF3267 domain-containing protein [Cloacibacterium caeni]
MNFENYTQEKQTIDLVKANFVAIKYFLFFSFIFLLPFYLIWGIDYFHIIKSESFLIRLFLSVFIPVFGIVIHELIHGIFFAKYASKGFKSVKFGVLLKMLTPYCHCKEPLKIKHYIIALLAPLVILGIFPAIVGILIGNFGLTIFGIFFSGAAAGDLMIYNLIKKENPEDYVQDHPSEAGYYIFRKK